MAESIDEISYDFEDEGRLVRRELERQVLSKGAWSTIMFLYQELDRQKNEWRAPKIAIVRYKKFNGIYRKQSGFNISSEKQARQIVGAIDTWYAEGKTYETAVEQDAPSAKSETAAADDSDTRSDDSEARSDASGTASDS